MPENYPDPSDDELKMLTKYEYNEKSYISGGAMMDILGGRVSKE